MSSLQPNYRKVANSPNYIYTSITPDDVAELPLGTALIGINGNGTGGSIAIEQVDGSTFTFSSLQVGSSIFVNAVKVLATGTTATGVFAGSVN